MGRACILRAVKTSSCTTEIQISPHQASTNKSSKQVPLFFYTLYIEGEGGTTAGEGEAIVRVHVTDANDNRPIGREVVADSDRQQMQLNAERTREPQPDGGGRLQGALSRAPLPVQQAGVHIEALLGWWLDQPGSPDFEVLEAGTLPLCKACRISP